jgi:hypothetical protein
MPYPSHSSNKNIMLVVFYTEQRVKKQLLDDPLHLNSEVIG